MAVTATPKSKTLVIEIETGKDKAGDSIWGKKSFSGVKLTATDQAVHDVAELIKTVLDPITNATLLNEVDTLVNA